MSEPPGENSFPSLMLKPCIWKPFVSHVTGRKRFDGHLALPRSVHTQVVPKESCAMSTFFAKWLSPKAHLFSSWSHAKHLEFSLKRGPGPTHGYFFFFFWKICVYFLFFLFPLCCASGNNWGDGVCLVLEAPLGLVACHAQVCWCFLKIA